MLQRLVTIDNANNGYILRMFEPVPGETHREEALVLIARDTNELFQGLKAIYDDSDIKTENSITLPEVVGPKGAGQVEEAGVEGSK
jgi:hypothetical protein